MGSVRTGAIIFKKSFVFIYFYTELILFIEDSSGTSMLLSLLQRKQNLEGIFPQTEL
jgi:hypothetical protein